MASRLDERRKQSDTTKCASTANCSGAVFRGKLESGRTMFLWNMHIRGEGQAFSSCEFYSLPLNFIEPSPMNRCHRRATILLAGGMPVAPGSEIQHPGRTSRSLLVDLRTEFELSVSHRLTLASSVTGPAMLATSPLRSWPAQAYQVDSAKADEFRAVQAFI